MLVTNSLKDCSVVSGFTARKFRFKLLKSPPTNSAQPADDQGLMQQIRSVMCDYQELPLLAAYTTVRFRCCCEKPAPT